MSKISILLTDHESINEKIIIKSITNLKKSKLKEIYFIGDKEKFKKIFKETLKIKKFYFIDIKLNQKKYFLYLKNCLLKAIELFKKKKNIILINMPLNKKKYLKKKFPGFTEFFSHCIDNTNNQNMLIYNEQFSVCPLTTHIELKNVEKNIKEKNIINAVENIVSFYKNIIKKKIKIKILGINPHASLDFNKKNIDLYLVKKIIKIFKKRGVNIEGPLSADTAFFKTKKSVFIGMYHDQVLIPFKIINKFNGINITIGKKYLRLSPDHGTGSNILKKNKLISNESFLKCIKFCEKYC